MLLIAACCRAANLYISPNGTPSGPGTLSQPYDLVTALSGQVGQPGDTFWLTGGNYVIGHHDTKIAGAPGEPITFRPVPGQAVRVDGSVTFWDSTGHVILQGFEMYNSDTNRVSAESGVGFHPTDIHIIPGIACYAPNMSFINLVIHDETRHGIYVSQQASNTLIYGCIIYNNGWRSPDNAEGHGLYVQGWNGGRVIEDNIVFNNSGADVHVYDNATGDYLAGITLDGNVAFNAGAIQDVRPYRDWIVGVDTPAVYADRIVFDNNMGYFPPNPDEEDQAQLGRDGLNGSVAVLDNYLPQGLEMNNWTIAAVARNVLAAQGSNALLTVNQDVSLAAAWDDNTYVASTNVPEDILANSKPVSFSYWQSGTGFDIHSTYRPGPLSGTRVFVRPNDYETGRANIIVYNWDDLTNVAVDVSSALAPGTPFEVRNAEDFFAAPVLTGVYEGQTLDLPMSGLTVAVPNGPMLTPAPTGPTFNVFVLLPQYIQLQAVPVNGNVRISWPTNAGHWVLQFTTSLSSGSPWMDVTNAIQPAFAGGHYQVTVPISGNSGFYRLKAVP